MRRTFVILVTGSLLVSTLSAQGTKIVVGLGLGLDVATTPAENAFGVDGTGATILVPIIVSRRTRLQPSLGYLHSSWDGGNTSGPLAIDWRRLSIGLAAHYLFPIKDAVRVYVGGGAGIGLSKWSEESSGFKGTANWTDWSLHVATGGEYYLVSRFSAGGEVRLEYLSLGAPSVNQVGTPPPLPPDAEFTRTLSVTQTSAQVTVRWYFGEAR